MFRTKCVSRPLLGCLNVQAEARLACIPATRRWSWEQDQEAAGDLEDEHVNLPVAVLPSLHENETYVVFFHSVKTSRGKIELVAKAEQG